MIILYYFNTPSLVFVSHRLRAQIFEVFELDKFVELIKLQMRESMLWIKTIRSLKKFSNEEKCNGERLERVHYKIKGYFLSELISVTTSLSLVSFHPSHLLLNGTMISAKEDMKRGILSFKTVRGNISLETISLNLYSRFMVAVVWRRINFACSNQ